MARSSPQKPVEWRKERGQDKHIGHSQVTVSGRETSTLQPLMGTVSNRARDEYVRQMTVQVHVAAVQ